MATPKSVTHADSFSLLCSETIMWIHVQEIELFRARRNMGNIGTWLKWTALKVQCPKLR